MDRWLDNLARGLARGVSRRVLLRGLAGMLGGAALGSVLPRTGLNGSDSGPNAAPNPQTCIPDLSPCQGMATGGGGCSGVCGHNPGGPGLICLPLTPTPTATP